MVDVLTQHLTTAGDPAMAQAISASVPGMAHFAGTGPAGATCRQCDFWARRFSVRNQWGGFEDCDDPVTSFKRDPDGKLCRRSCKKFYRMMQHTRGEPVPPNMPACRHFVENPNAPPVDRPASKPRKKSNE